MTNGLVFHCNTCDRVFHDISELVSGIAPNGRPTNKCCPTCNVQVEVIEDGKVVETTVTTVDVSTVIKWGYEQKANSEGAEVDFDEAVRLACEIDGMEVPTNDEKIELAGHWVAEFGGVVAVDAVSEPVHQPVILERTQDGTFVVGAKVGVVQKSWAGFEAEIVASDGKWTTVKVTQAPKGFNSQIGKQFRTRVNRIFYIHPELYI